MAIRNTHFWVEVDEPIYLFLDNACGHGTSETVDKYVAMLKTYYNVICIHQHPRSPARNMLNLRVWMALKSVVEKLHFHQQNEIGALCRTVTRACEELNAIKLTNVYERWKMVLDLILKDDGGDRFIKSNHGKLFRAPSQETEDLDEDDVRHTADAENITAEDIDLQDLDLESWG